MAKSQPLPSDEQIQLVVLAQAGDMAARDRIVEATLPLVRHIAYQFAPNAAGFEVDDLIQEGCFALLEAIRYFKPALGNLFSTYAGTSIRNRLARYIETRTAKPITQEGIGKDENLLETVPDVSPVVLERLDEIRESLKVLPVTQKRIVEMRLGTDGAVHNWRDIANHFGISSGTAQEAFNDSITRLKRWPVEPSLN